MTLPFPPLDFSHAAYSALLAWLRQDGRKVAALRELDQDCPERCVFLRHDIDFSLEKAVVMARLDSAAGVSASVFILLTAPYYNALSAEGRARLREIAALGHEIGLHYDLSLIEQLNPEQQLASIQRQADMLAEAAQSPVTSIARHKPGRSQDGLGFPGFLSAYEPRWCGDIGYMSDSKMRIGRDDPATYLDQHPRLQLLIHPLWWNTQPLSRQQVFRQLGEDSADAQAELLDAEDAHIARGLSAQP